MGTKRGISTILLTGGTGFFGKAVLRHWMAEEQRGLHVPEIVVLSRNPRRFLDTHPEFSSRSWLSFHAGDILDRTSLPDGRTFTHILHAAADSTLGPKLLPLDVYRQIADGTLNILDFAVRIGARRFLFVSSGAVYGRQPHDLDRLPENWPGSPPLTDSRSTYGLAKRSAEHLCALYRHQFGLDTVIARCFAFIGPDLALDAHFAIGNFIRDALWRDAVTVEGDGTAVRSYLHQGDLASWLCTLLMAAKPGTPYNVGSDQPIAIAELAQLVRDCLAPGMPIRMPTRGNDVSPTSRYVPDISLIRHEVGVSVSVGLRDAIIRTADVLRTKRCPLPSVPLDGQAHNGGFDRRTG